MSGDVTPNRIIQTGFRFLASKALFAAVELGVFTELAEEPLTREALEERLDLHPRASADFLDALVALGFLERDDGLYRNAPDADLYLDQNKETYVGDALALGNNRMYPAWMNLADAVRTGEPQVDLDDDDEYFNALYEADERLERFASSMTGFSLAVATVIAETFEWEEYETVCDLGTAEGQVPVTIAEKNPHIEATAFDLPKLEPISMEFIAERGMDDRVSFHGGNFLEDPLPEHDVFILGRIIHDWGLSGKKEILERAYEALPEGGVLLVYGTMIDNERRENEMGLLVSLNTLVETADGFDYTPQECETWLREVGFSKTEVRDLPTPETMVVATK
ncbi:methyltransferase [Natrinema ejinorense]|uniref:Methyltransferase n=1 Tax=Natrinema ejinorense TaxID=373386 RepID=A0A2A5QRX2_9EURY|nr:methyltransferase [Natrinema ejinorense]PCR89587.1 methyltransferase [Natrinema ejinorense]